MNPAATRRRRAGMPALDLMEEAVGLLRRGSADTLLIYLLGAVPFWLGLLYFIADMAHDAYAPRRIPEASLAVAVLYVWMKCWQTAFTARLRDLLADRPGAPWTVARVLRLVATQAAWQPWGFIVRPIAANLLFPYSWVATFFQNVTILGDGTRDHDETLAARAWAQAKLWPGQAHAALSILWVFTFFVWLNVGAVLGLAPVALKGLLGIETAFSRSLESYFNTTFFTASFALASLLVDPLWKAAYVLRCFRGAALRTGEDLAVELRHARPVAMAALALMLACNVGRASSLSESDRHPCLSSAANRTAQHAGRHRCLPDFDRLEARPTFRRCAAARAADAPPPANVEATELDQRIGQVLERREYAWRAPREVVVDEAETNWFRAWMRGIGQAFEKSFKAAGRKVDQFFRAVFGRLFPPASTAAGKIDWLTFGKVALIAVSVVCVGLLTWAILRLLRGPGATVAAAVPAAPVPDLRSEHIVADQLPVDGWMQLAREHAARGELALALRAAWLAGLAHLGQRELLRLARHKSNRDYDRELRRRARSHADLLAAFDENLLAVERAWYGRHSVTPGDFTTFTGNLERIRTC